MRGHMMCRLEPSVRSGGVVGGHPGGVVRTPPLSDLDLSKCVSDYEAGEVCTHVVLHKPSDLYIDLDQGPLLSGCSYLIVPRSVRTHAAVWC